MATGPQMPFTLSEEALDRSVTECTPNGGKSTELSESRKLTQLPGSKLQTHVRLQVGKNFWWRRLNNATVHPTFLLHILDSTTSFIMTAVMAAGR